MKETNLTWYLDAINYNREYYSRGSAPNSKNMLNNLNLKTNFNILSTTKQLIY